jgi:hypothetical protein
MQEVVLTEALASPNTGLYVPQIVLSVDGDLDERLLQQVWDQLIERHSIFRTSFNWERADGPLQVVTRTAYRPVAYYDWRHYSMPEQHEKLRALIDENLKEGFDLKQAPLARLTLIRLTESSYRVIWSCHHILMDGWSGSLIMAELFNYYTALAQGDEFQFSPVRPYRDYIDWLSQQDTTEAEEFWRQTLRGFTHPTHLIIDRVNGESVESDDDSEWKRLYGDVYLGLSEETTGKLIKRAREHGLTLYTLIEGAWALLLSRYCSQDHVMFGTVVSGRPHDLDRVEEMVGLFINTLPVCVKIPRKTSLLAWLHELQAQQVEVRNYQYTRLSDIQRWSELPANTPLFGSIIRFQNFPVDRSLQVEDERSLSSAVLSVDWWHYPLCLVVGTGPKLFLSASYKRSQFDRVGVIGLLEEFRDLLRRMAADLSQPVVVLRQPMEARLSAGHEASDLLSSNRV